MKAEPRAFAWRSLSESLKGSLSVVIFWKVIRADDRHGLRLFSLLPPPKVLGEGGGNRELPRLPETSRCLTGHPAKAGEGAGLMPDPRKPNQHLGVLHAERRSL